MLFVWIIIFLLSIMLPSVTTLPIIFVVILCLFVITKSPSIFALGFLAGLLMDFSSLNPLGKTSLFFVIFLFVALLYDKKFEIKTFPFVLIASFMGSTAYLWIFGYDYILWQAGVGALLAALLFKIFNSQLTVFNK